MEIKNDILVNKILYLKPVANKSGIIKDENHIAFFKMEGAYDMYTLKMDEKTQKYVNPFFSDKEIKFFSEALGEDLNPFKQNNTFWGSYFVKIIKTPELMSIGKKFDLSNVHDALAYRVLLTWKREIAPNWESRLNYSTIRYAFVEEGYDENVSTEEMDELFKVGTYYGEIKVSDSKMKEFLDVYYMTSSKNIVIPDDFTTNQLIAEISKIIKNDKKGFISTYEDKDYKYKSFINKAIKKGAIKKIGIGTYIINGVQTEYYINELIAQIKSWDETKTDPIYAKLIALTK